MNTSHHAKPMRYRPQSQRRSGRSETGAPEAVAAPPRIRRLVATNIQTGNDAERRALGLCPSCVYHEAGPDDTPCSSCQTGIRLGKGPGKHLTVEEQRAVAAAYRSGGTATQLARDYGCSDQTVRAIVRRFGGELRPHGSDHRRRR